MTGRPGQPGLSFYLSIKQAGLGRSRVSSRPPSEPWPGFYVGSAPRPRTADGTQGTLPLSYATTPFYFILGQGLHFQGRP